DEGSLHHEQRRGQRREEADGAQGIAEHGARNVDQERNERRLIYVSPTEVIAARNVIEFVAKISVAVVEINVEQQLGERYQPDYDHGSGEKRLLIAIREGNSRSGRHRSSVRRLRGLYPQCWS